MDSQEIIAVYETVAILTGQMLEAARNGDWDELAVLESRCTSQVDILRNEESPIPALSGAIREKKVKIIQQILEDDREIRNLTEPWMAQLSALINSASAERKLTQAYGSNQAG